MLPVFLIGAAAAALGLLASGCGHQQKPPGTPDGNNDSSSKPVKNPKPFNIELPYICHKNESRDLCAVYTTRFNEGVHEEYSADYYVDCTVLKAENTAASDKTDDQIIVGSICTLSKGPQNN